MYIIYIIVWYNYSFLMTTPQPIIDIDIENNRITISNNTNKQIINIKITKSIENNLVFDDKDVTITYHVSNIKHAIYHGSVYVNMRENASGSGSGSVDIINLISINPNIGELKRLGDPNKFSITFIGNFKNSTRLKSGKLILPERKIQIESSEYVYIDKIIDNKKILSDILIYNPVITNLDFTGNVDIYDYLYKYSSIKYNNKPYVSLEKIINHLEQGKYEKLKEKYIKIFTDCYTYGKNKLKSGKFEENVAKDISDSICTLVYLKSIGETDTSSSININDYFDKLVEHNIKNNLYLLFNDKTKHPYDIPNHDKIAKIDTFYKLKYSQLNISIKSNELQILVPFDILNNKIYYMWKDINPDNNQILYFDTGNHSTSIMSRKYFENIYLSECNSDKKKFIIDSILDTSTKPDECFGIGGKDCSKHIGFIDITFIFTNYPNKGKFNITCDIRENQFIDILIGDKNKPNSISSNMNTILLENKVCLTKN